MPPPWYALQTSEFSSQPYIALPSSTDTTTTTSSSNTPPRIFLTAFHTSDAPALQAVLDTPSINDSLISVPKPYTLADAHFWIGLQLPSGTDASPPWLQALRCGDPDTGTFIGAVSLVPAASSSYALTTTSETEDVDAAAPDKNDDDGNGNGNDGGEDDYYLLGYYLRPDFHRRGIMRDAVLALLAWAAAERGVKRVRVDVAADNLGSRRLVESLDGFQREESGGKGEQELLWPESKGGARRKILSWRWTSQ